MNRHLLLRIAAVAAVVIGTPACAYLFGSWGGGTPAVAVTDAIKFSHKKHVVDESLACTDCHEGVQDSTGLDKGRFMPLEAKCMDCHDKTDENCTMCHVRPDKPTTWVDTRFPDLRFDHKKHLAGLAAQNIKGCDTCHADVTKATKVSETARPRMFETCLKCHERDFRKENCVNCHTKLTDMKQRPLTVFDHGADWLRRHGAAAKGGEAVCSHCHAEPSCTECHARNNPIRPSLLHLDGADKAFMHRGDWLPRHSIEARLDGKACLACHTENSCVTCHDRLGIASATQGGPNPHPPGWLTPGSKDNHGTAARRDALSCAACHDRGAASNCVTCHKSGGPGGNPHPPGWQSDLDRRSATGCIPCHR
jgi:hypothetical protein